MKTIKRLYALAWAILAPALTATLLLTPVQTSASIDVIQETSALQAGHEQAKAAVDRLKKASNLNDPAATRLLGDAYRSGQGVTKDTSAAFGLYTEAARAGDAVAQLRMGECYHRGEGTDSNQISAWVWLTLASSEESPVKDQALSLRETVTRSLTEPQQDRARLLAENLQHMLQQ